MNKFHPFFTIIIPTFNAEKKISTTLDSVFSQCCKSYEVIIVDSLSCDNTLDVARGYKGVKIISEKDKGVYDAMNKGVAASSGDWIIFLGAGDRIYSSETLGVIKRGIEKHSVLWVFYGNVKRRMGAIGAEIDVIYDGKFDRYKLFKQNICHQAIVYNKSVLTRFPFNTTYPILADYDLNIRLWALKKFIYLDVIVAYYEGGGMSSIIKDEKFIKNKLKILKKNFIFWFLDIRILSHIYLKPTVRALFQGTFGRSTKR